MSAELNNSDALDSLGFIYYLGDYVEEDIQKAIMYYGLVAKFNNSEALNKLGDIYFEGDDVEENIPKAKKYYESAARLNNPKAINSLGDLYYSSEYVEENIQKMILMIIVESAHTTDIDYKYIENQTNIY